MELHTSFIYMYRLEKGIKILRESIDNFIERNFFEL